MSMKRGAIIAATAAALLSLAAPAHAMMPVPAQTCQEGGGAVNASASFGGMGQCTGGAHHGAVIIILP